MMGLRLAEGVAKSRIADESGLPFDRAIDRRRLDRLVAGGFLAEDSDRLTASPAGRQRLDAVLAALLG